MRRRAMKSLLVASCLLGALPQVAFGQTATPVPYGADFRPVLSAPEPVAAPDGATAIVFNPAALDPRAGDEILYVHGSRREDGAAGDGDALYWKGARLFNVAVEWARPARNVDRPLFTLAGTLPLGPSASLGFGHVTTLGHSFSPVAFESTTLGLLIRPYRMLSLGGALWNGEVHGAPVGYDLRTRYAAGLAIRPLPFDGWRDRLLLAGDLLKTDGQRGEDWRATARFTPWRGVGLSATYDEQEQLSVGVSLSLTHVSGGARGFYDKSGRSTGLSTSIRAHERRQPAFVQVRPTYARVVVPSYLPDHSVRGPLEAEVATLPEFLGELGRARRDPQIKGLIVRLDGAGGALGRAQEIRDALLGMRAAGKKVLCYIEGTDTRTYYVATACERIVLHPAGSVLVDGVTRSIGFFKGTLDKLGVEFEIARVGEFKAAVEPFTRSEPSKEMAQNFDEILDAAFATYTDGIAQGRGLSPKDVRSLIDRGYFSATAAKDAKLVDALAYPDEVRTVAADFLGAHAVILHDYAIDGPAEADWGVPPTVGVVYASGTIATGDSGSTPLSGEEMLGSRTLVRALRQATDDPTVRAIVLRVDSPGGDGFASDQVWRAVARAREKKPVVVSMADVAASGGYYISMGANEIFADPGTITGSIGVFAMRPNARGLMEKLAYKNHAFSRGALSELFDNTSRPMTGPEKETLQRVVDDFYRDFIAKAGKGRSKTPEAIDALGRGRVWTGAAAKEKGLIDSLGGLREAVRRAAELAKMRQPDRVAVRAFPERSGSWGRLFGREERPLPDEVRNAITTAPFGDLLGVVEATQRMTAGGPLTWTATDDLAPRAKVAARRDRNWVFWPLPDLRRQETE